MKTFKAKIVEITYDDFEVAVNVASKWRVFGTCVVGDDPIAYKSIRKAKAGAEKVAKAFGIKLEWVK